MRILRISCLFCLLITALAPALVVQAAPSVAREEPQLELRSALHDLVDGWITVRTIRKVAGEGGPLAGQLVTEADGLKWDILEGEAEVRQDPHTGLTHFRPAGTDPVVAQPRIGSLVGEPLTVGISPGVALLEQPEAASGGGACRTAGGLVDIVDVRSVTEETMVPLSLVQREVPYLRGEYYSYDPGVGPMRITYNPDYASRTLLTSNSETGEPFFPAAAYSEFYFIIEILDNGVRMFNREPMVLTSPAVGWPPFGVPQVNQGPVGFFAVDDPTVELMRIESQEMYLYPTQELAVNPTSLELVGDRLDVTFQIENLTEHGGDLRWFLMGDLGEPLTPVRGLRPLAARDTFEVSFSSRVSPSLLTQSISLGVVSQSGERLTGAHRITFRYTP